MKVLLEELMFSQSSLDRCLFWRTVTEDDLPFLDWVVGDWIIVILWTDDLPFGGTAKMKQWFRNKVYS